MLATDSSGTSRTQYALWVQTRDGLQLNQHPVNEPPSPAFAVMTKLEISGLIQRFLNNQPGRRQNHGKNKLVGNFGWHTSLTLVYSAATNSHTHILSGSFRIPWR